MYIRNTYPGPKARKKRETCYDPFAQCLSVCKEIERHGYHFRIALFRSGYSKGARCDCLVWWVVLAKEGSGL